MIAEVKGARLLPGFRGRPATDLEALEDTLVRMSHLAMHLEGHSAELDINPLMVLPSGQGVKAVDASSCSAAHSGQNLTLGTRSGGRLRPRADFWPRVPSVGFCPGPEHCCGMKWPQSLRRCFRCSSSRIFTASDIRFAAEICACGQLDPAKNSGALRCSSLFLILIEIAWYFADLRTPSSSLARPQDMGPAGPPVFAENLQALLFRLRSPPRRSQYHRIAIRHSHVARRCELLQKCAALVLLPTFSFSTNKLVQC